MTTTLLTLFIAIILINHIALTRCYAQYQLTTPSSALSVGSLCGLLTASTLILGITLFDVVNQRILTPYKLEVLYHFFYVLIIALMAHMACLIMSKVSPRCATLTPQLFPLLTLNGLVLGLIILLLQPSDIYKLITLSATGAVLFYAGLSWFWHFDEYAQHYDVPSPLKGIGISLITCAILVMLITGLINFK